MFELAFDAVNDSRKDYHILPVLMTEERTIVFAFLGERSELRCLFVYACVSMILVLCESVNMNLIKDLTFIWSVPWNHLCEMFAVHVFIVFTVSQVILLNPAVGN